MLKKKHYATRAKERIWFLEQQIRIYYMANYHAKEAVGERQGVCGVAGMEGNEEGPVIVDAKGMRDIILNLPLNDCGV